jgi:gas vesicle protein
MTSSTDPDEIRAQMEATRAGLSQDVNELGVKVNPANVIQRQKEKVVGSVKGSVVGVKDHIMGSADGVKSSTGDAMSSVQGAVADAPGKVARQAKGNPMAAGMIAFGAGMLLSALIPASKKEAEAAAALKQQARPLIGQLTSTVKEAAGHLQEPAQQALESVKSTANDAVSAVKDEGTSAAGEVKSQAQDAKAVVQDQASSS